MCPSSTNALLVELRHKCKEAKFAFSPRLDDAFLSKFLQVRRNNVNQALATMQIYYENVARNLDHTAELEASKLTSEFESEAFVPLKRRSSGRRVLIFRVRNWDATKLLPRNVLLTALYQGGYVAMETQTQENGLVVVFDLAGLSFQHLKQYSFKDLKLVASMAQGALPLSVCEIHLVNVSYLVWSVYHAICALLKKKIRDRMHIHYNPETLHKYVEPQILPSSLGGEIEESAAWDTKLIHQIIQENRRYEDFWNAEKLSYSETEQCYKRNMHLQKHSAN